MSTYARFEVGTLLYLAMCVLIIGWRFVAQWRLLRRTHQQLDALLAQTTGLDSDARQPLDRITTARPR